MEKILDMKGKEKYLSSGTVLFVILWLVTSWQVRKSAVSAAWLCTFIYENYGQIAVSYTFFLYQDADVDLLSFM